MAQPQQRQSDSQIEPRSDLEVVREAAVPASTRRPTQIIHCDQVKPSTGQSCNTSFQRRRYRRHMRQVHGLEIGANGSLRPVVGGALYYCTKPKPQSRGRTQGEPCNSSFGRKYELERHDREIHGKRTVGEKAWCDFCRKEVTFSRKGEFKRHLKRQHNVEV